MQLIADMPAHEGPDAQAPVLAYLTKSRHARFLSVVVSVGGKRVVAADRITEDTTATARSVQEALERLLSGSEAVASAAVRSNLAHALSATGQGRPHRSEFRGGLSSGQRRIAMAMLSSNLDGPVSTAEVASACRVSEGHFSRAFRTSIGMSPNRWRLEQRLHFCRTRLIESTDALSCIAREAGFPEQSYFSRVFTRASGLCPSEWRRIFRSAACAADAAFGPVKGAA